HRSCDASVYRLLGPLGSHSRPSLDLGGILRATRCTRTRRGGGWLSPSRSTRHGVPFAALVHPLPGAGVAGLAVFENVTKCSGPIGALGCISAYVCLLGRLPLGGRHSGPQCTHLIGTDNWFR